MISDLSNLLSSTQVVAVSKHRSVEEVQQLYQLGLRHFGENYLQEAIQKQEALKNYPDIVWHFLGSIQSNKIRAIAKRFDWVQSVDSELIGRQLSEEAVAFGRYLSICLQVNIDSEPQKRGIPLTEIQKLLDRLILLPGIRVRGLMALPKAGNSLLETKMSFKKIHNIFIALNQAGYQLDTLSMGTSRDFQIALEEGSTCIRLGRILFDKKEGISASC